MVIAELFAKLGLEVEEKTWEKGDKFIESIKHGFEGLLVAVEVDKLLEMVNGVSELADAAVKSSAKLGITIEAVQELGYAAKLSDISQQELEGSLTKLTRGLESAKDGTGPFADALHTLGIPMKNLQGKGLDENLGDIAQAFAALPDGSEKAALAMQLFGRTGTKLIPLLNGGRDGLNDLRKEAQDLGIVVDTETAKSFEEFNDDQTRLSETWRGLKTQVVSALLPAFRNLVNAVQAWVTTNRDAIKSTLTTVVEGLAMALRGVIGVLGLVSDAFSFFAQHSDLAKAIIIALTLVLTYFAAVAIAAWIAAAAPVIALIAVLTAVVLAVMDVWKGITQGKGVAIRVWHAIKQAVVSFVDYLISIPGLIVDAIENAAKAVYDAFSDAFDKVKDKAHETWNEIKNLPVIKQAFEVKNALFGSASDGLSPSQVAGLANGTVTPDQVIQQASSISFGDTHIDVQASPGMDAAQLADHIGQQANEVFQGKIKDAHEALRGGKR